MSAILDPVAVGPTMVVGEQTSHCDLVVVAEVLSSGVMRALRRSAAEERSVHPSDAQRGLEEVSVGMQSQGRESGPELGNHLGKLGNL